MSSQCGLCLSCGAPFLPVGEDMVAYDRLGNISVFYFQKLVRNDPMLQVSVENPKFCSKKDKSHLLHESNHEPAVRYMIDTFISNRRGDGGFPFIRNPKGKTPACMLAFWDPPQDADRIDFSKLIVLLNGMAADGVQAHDYDRVTPCCNDCNSIMTMRFWFQYHL